MQEARPETKSKHQQFLTFAVLSSLPILWTAFFPHTPTYAEKLIPAESFCSYHLFCYFVLFHWLLNTYRVSIHKVTSNKDCKPEPTITGLLLRRWALESKMRIMFVSCMAVLPLEEEPAQTGSEKVHSFSDCESPLYISKFR